VLSFSLYLVHSSDLYVGGANVFRLPYFGKEAYLAQSPQFYKQFEIAGGRKRVYVREIFPLILKIL
jgi:aspartyl/asparaginyl-tRNA synthetase